MTPSCAQHGTATISTNHAATAILLKLLIHAPHKPAGYEDD
jgi:hypothetical protein